MRDPDQHPFIPTAPWLVYIVRCRDGSYYTGITTDLARRIAEHNSPVGGAKYTKPRQPITLVYCEPAASRSVAARREHQIKKMPVTGKTRLIISAATAGAGLQQAESHADLPEDRVLTQICPD